MRPTEQLCPADLRLRRVRASVRSPSARGSAPSVAAVAEVAEAEVAEVAVVAEVAGAEVAAVAAEVAAAEVAVAAAVAEAEAAVGRRSSRSGGRPDPERPDRCRRSCRARPSSGKRRSRRPGSARQLPSSIWTVRSVEAPLAAGAEVHVRLHRDPVRACAQA